MSCQIRRGRDPALAGPPPALPLSGPGIGTMKTNHHGLPDRQGSARWPADIRILLLPTDIVSATMSREAYGLPRCQDRVPKRFEPQLWPWDESRPALFH